MVHQLLLPKVLQTEVLTSLHDNHGHQGAERTTALVRERCYWPNMHADIDQWCKECERCIIAKAVQPSVQTFMGHLTASKPLEVVAIDFTTLEKASDGREHVLVVTDVFSKFTQAYPTSDQRPILLSKPSQKSGLTPMECLNEFIQTRAATLKVNYSDASASCMGLQKAGRPHTTQKEMSSVRGSTKLF